MSVFSKMITKIEEFKMLLEFSIFKNKNDITVNKTENIIKKIQSKLMDDNNYNTWQEFVDNQESGDCQGIVLTIQDMNINEVKTFFGEIKVIDGIWDEDQKIYLYDENDYDDDEDDAYDTISEDEHQHDTTGKIMTHHWVTINGVICEFSKGTLKKYIDWQDLYNVDMDDSWETEAIIKSNN